MDPADLTRLLGALLVACAIALGALSRSARFRERQLLRRSENADLGVPEHLEPVLLRRGRDEDLGAAFSVGLAGVLLIALAPTVGPSIVTQPVMTGLIAALTALVCQQVGSMIGRRLSRTDEEFARATDGPPTALPLETVARRWEEPFTAGLLVAAVAAGAILAVFGLMGEYGSGRDALVVLGAVSALMAGAGAALLVVRRRMIPSVVSTRAGDGADEARAWDAIVRAERLREPLQLATLLAGVALALPAIVALSRAEESPTTTAAVVVGVVGLVVALSAPEGTALRRGDRYVRDQLRAAAV